MDLKKVGKYIADKRKTKGYTQEQLGEKIGINGNAISKWERGLNAPDISLLSEISEILDITLDELLKGEDMPDNISKNESNKGIIDSIKYYTRVTKIKYLKILIYISLIIVFVFSFLFMFNNYNRFKIYSIESSEDNFYVAGYIIYNQKRNLILVNNIDIKDVNIGTNQEEQIKYLKVSLKCDNKNIFSSEKIVENNNRNLNAYLLNVTYFADENVKSNENILVDESDVQKLRLVIEYTTIDSIDKVIDIPLSCKKEYSNNKILY